MILWTLFDFDSRYATSKKRVQVTARLRRSSSISLSIDIFCAGFCFTLFICPFWYPLNYIWLSEINECKYFGTVRLVFMNNSFRTKFHDHPGRRDISRTFVRFNSVIRRMCTIRSRAFWMYISCWERKRRRELETLRISALVHRCEVKSTTAHFILCGFCC